MAAIKHGEVNNHTAKKTTLSKAKEESRSKKT